MNLFLIYENMSEKRTYADRAEYIKKAVTRRRKMIRLKAIEYKGGKCSLCGYDKCILICANCHREEHSRLRSLLEKSKSEE